MQLEYSTGPDDCAIIIFDNENNWANDIDKQIFDQGFEFEKQKRRKSVKLFYRLVMGE